VRQARTLLQAEAVADGDPAYPVCLPILIAYRGSSVLVEIFLRAAPTEQELARFNEGLRKQYPGDDIRCGDHYEYDLEYDPRPPLASDEKGLAKEFWFGSFATGDSDFTKEQIQSVLSPIFKIYAAQAETGQRKGFRHVQFVGQTPRPIKFHSLSGALAASPGVQLPIWLRWKKRKALTHPKGCVAYCTKADTAVPGTTVTVGLEELGGDQGKRNDWVEMYETCGQLAKRFCLDKEAADVLAKTNPKLGVLYRDKYIQLIDDLTPEYVEPPLEQLRDYQQELWDIIHGPIHSREIICVEDKDGNSGKSRFVDTLNAKGVTCETFHAGEYRDHAEKWKGVYRRFLDTSKPRVVFFEFQSSTAPSLVRDCCRFIEALKDGRVESAKWHGQTIKFPRPHIVVFSNDPMSEQSFRHGRLRHFDWSGHHLD